jgi:Fic family protein
MSKYDPHINLTPQIVSLIEHIAKLQGKISAASEDSLPFLDLQTTANIDAVHFSTKLEGNKLTLKQVTEVLALGKNKLKGQSRDLKEVINYAKTRQHLFSKASSSKTNLSHALILKSHDLLQSGIVSGKLRGFYRQSQNVIRDEGSKKIHYLPPEAKDVYALMGGLTKWVHKSQLEELSPLIISALFHYRFVTIHPFIDGNGRCARLLTNYLLNTSGYSIGLYAALEKHHELERGLYYQALYSAQGSNFYDIPIKVNLSQWLTYWLTCLKKTYLEGLKRVESSVGRNQIVMVDVSDRLQKALSLFQKYKTLKASDYEALMGVGRTQAVEDLNQLSSQGKIKKIGGGRSTKYTLC